MRNSVLFLCALLGGCAGEQAMRSTSAQTAAMLQQYRTAFTDFAEQQNGQNDAAERRIADLSSMTGQRIAEIESRTLAWSLDGNTRASGQFALTNSKGPDDILATLPSQPPPPAPALKFDPAPIDALVKELAGLEKAPDAKARLADAIAYGTGLRTAYEADVKSAADSAAVATSQTHATAAIEQTSANSSD